MNEVVPRNKAAVVNVLPAADRTNWNQTTTRINDSVANGTKTQNIAPIARITPPMEANSTIPRTGWISAILALTPWKNANVAIVKIMKPKIVKPVSKVGAWDIFGVIAAVGPNL